MEDDGNSSNSTNDKNDTAEKIQGGETSHIIKMCTAHQLIPHFFISSMIEVYTILVLYDAA